MHRAVTLAALTLLSTSCIAPRSAGVGQTALPMAAGGMEVAASPGLLYRAQNGPPIPSGGNASNVATDRTLGGSGEANFLLGLTDAVGLNVHVSPAGLQPGAKISFRLGGLQLALLPEFAVGYWSDGGSSEHTQAGAVTNRDSGGHSMVEVLLGAKLIASHSSGLYAAIGYDYQQIVTTNLGPDAQGRGRVDFAHALSLAAGWELGSGAIKVRPEVALLYLGSVGGWSTTANGSHWDGSGSEFVLFPNVTIAWQTAHPGQPSGPEGMKPEELSVPPVFAVP
jgi:hypothetical protein